MRRSPNHDAAHGLFYSTSAVLQLGRRSRYKRQPTMKVPYAQSELSQPMGLGESWITFWIGLACYCTSYVLALIASVNHRKRTIAHQQTTDLHLLPRVEGRILRIVASSVPALLASRDLSKCTVARQQDNNRAGPPLLGRCRTSPRPPCPTPERSLAP